MKVIGYARVSSREQSQNSNALEQQIERLKTAGASEIFVDVESGWKNSDRPNLNKVLALVQSKQVSQVVVTRLDRLSRKGLQSFQIFELFLKSGVTLKALDEPFDLTTAAGRAMAGQLVVFAQLHSDQKAEAVQHGWEHLRDSKIAVNPPFGYCKVNNRHELDRTPFLCLVETQEELSKADIARDIVNAFLSKKTLRLALREINTRYGIQTFAHNNKAGEKKKGGRVAQGVFKFSTSGLSNWLTNPVLRGHLPYLRKKKDSDRSQIHLDTHPDHRLISDAEFREIENILAHNKQVRGYGSTALKYPLSGLVFCGECRSSCYSVSGANNYHKAKKLGVKPDMNYYFQCKNWTARSCTQKTLIRMEVAEAAVIDALVQKAGEIADIAEISGLQESPDTPEIQKLSSQLFQLQEINKINPNEAIKTAIAQLENQITQLRYSLSEKQDIDVVSRELLLWAFSDKELWKNATNEDKQRVYRELVEAVIVKNGQVTEVKLKI
jgi:site-specific DNA recombinase